MRGLALALCFLLVAASAARGEERPDMRLDPPFPDNTVSSSELPWYEPLRSSDNVGLRVWCDEMTAFGRRREGTRLGGDALLAAAHVLYHRVKDKKEAFRVYGVVAEAYPTNDPTRAVAIFTVAQRESWRGRYQAVEQALKELDDWADRSWPKRTSHEDARRWSLLAEIIDEKVPVLRADWHEAGGRYREAAALLEKLAGTTQDALVIRRGYWERAARLYARGRDRASAMRAADQAIELAKNDEDRTYWTVWRVYAEHGKLMKNGAIGPTRGKGPDAFYDDLLRAARDRAGEGMFDTYLSMGSSAFVADKLEIALEIYLLALRDPEFIERALKDGAVRGGALTGVGIAADLGRFEDAEWIFATIERMAESPIEDFEMFRRNIEKARTKLDDALRTKGRTPPKRAPIQDPKPRLERLKRIETGDADPEDDFAPLPPDEGSGVPMWAWIAVAGVLAFVFLRLVRR